MRRMIMEKALKLAARHLVELSVVVGVLVAAVGGITYASNVDARNAKWTSVTAVAVDDSTPLKGERGEVVDFTVGEQRIDAVVVDQRVFAGNRYDAWFDGETVSLGNPQLPTVLLAVVFGSLSGLGVFMMLAFMAVTYGHRFERWAERQCNIRRLDKSLQNVA
jgi:hypothetical protein